MYTGSLLYGNSSHTPAQPTSIVNVCGDMWWLLNDNGRPIRWAEPRRLKIYPDTQHRQTTSRTCTVKRPLQKPKVLRRAMGQVLLSTGWKPIPYTQLWSMIGDRRLSQFFFKNTVVSTPPNTVHWPSHAYYAMQHFTLVETCEYISPYQCNTYTRLWRNFIFQFYSIRKFVQLALDHEFLGPYTVLCMLKNLKKMHARVAAVVRLHRYTYESIIKYFYIKLILKF